MENGTSNQRKALRLAGTVGFVRGRNVGEKPVLCEDRQTAETARYFGRFAREMTEHGIPPWVDFRRSADYPWERSRMWFDLKSIQILLGDVVERILARAGEAKGGRALDLGCGGGWLSLELARCGLHVEGMDVAEEQLEIAREAALANPFTEGFGSVTYRAADLNHLTLEEAAYDLIVSVNALNCISRLEPLLQMVERALKPGGRLLVCDETSRDWRHKLLTGLFYLALPNDASIWQRGMKIFRRLLGGDRLLFTDIARRCQVPMEQALSWRPPIPRIIALAEKFLVVEEVRHSLAFVEPFALHLGWGDGWAFRHRHTLLQLLRRLDDFLVRARLVPGLVVLLTARKPA
jgi:SAM-dependent methyltransferase